MADVYGESGPGYARTRISPWDAAGGAVAGGGGAGNITGSLSGIIDPNLIRQAMLMKLDQGQRGFEAWMAGKEQARYLADQDERRAREVFKEGQEERKQSRRTAGRARAVREPAERSAVANERARDVSQTQALTGRVPTRMSTIGTQTFATPDPLKMTGAQRMQFLPGTNVLRPETGRLEQSGLDSDAAFAAMIAGLRGRQASARY